MRFTQRFKRLNAVIAESQRRAAFNQDRERSKRIRELFDSNTEAGKLADEIAERMASLIPPLPYGAPPPRDPYAALRDDPEILEKSVRLAALRPELL